MPLMTWTEKMSVGVAVLDGDHRKLVGMVNTLFDEIQSGKGKEGVGKTLDSLVSYTVEHFKREEQFFAKTSYSESAAHIAEHQKLCKQVADVQQRYKAGATTALTLEVMSFLKNWLTNHIMGSDKKYGPHLNSKGIK